MNEMLTRLLKDQEDNHILPFFWQHGEDAETLAKYMQVIYDSNIRAVCVESRPHPDFAGPKWWEDMDVILGEAKRLGMKVWILDDSHFPTGVANGAVEHADESLRRLQLARKVVEVGGGETAVIEAQVLAEPEPWKPASFETYTVDPSKFTIFPDELAAAVLVKAGGCADGDRIDVTDKALAAVAAGEALSLEVPEGEWRLELVHKTRNRGPRRNSINLMDMESCRILIDAVYEKHYEHYGDLFGTIIEGFFSDEPELGNGHLYEMGLKIGELDDQCWSRTLEAELKELWGADYNKNLPLLWNSDYDKDVQAKVRCEYMDHVTRLVEKCFSFQVGDWCRAHGVKYIGHLIEDNHAHSRTVCSLGHYFRGLAGQDWAGIDCIGGQVMPQGEGTGQGDFLSPVRDGDFWQYTLGKLGASMAYLDPLKHGDSMCEIFGNYGWKEGVRLEKYLADHMMIRGINNYVPHAFTAKAFPDPDCPPHFYAHGHNPQYRHFGWIMKYMNRVTTLMSGGKPEIPAGILYNGEADWAGDIMYMQEPAIRLYDHQVDYLFVPADAFAEREHYGTKLGKEMVIGGQSFKVLLIPQMEYIPAVAAKAALELTEAGGKVFFVGARPSATIEGGKNDPLVAAMEAVPVLTLDEIPAAMERLGVGEITLTPADDRVRFTHYQGGEDLFYFFNEGAKTYRGTVKLPEGSYVRYDAWENKAYRCEGSDVAVCMAPSESALFIRVPVEKLAEFPAEPELPEKVVDLNEGWKRSYCVALDYPKFGEAAPVSFPDPLADEAPQFSGFVRYEREVEVAEAAKRCVLKIEDAYEGVELFVDGVSQGIQVISPYIYDVTELMGPGKHQLAIEVATTLEREAVDYPSAYGGLMPKPVVTVPTGIQGGVEMRVE